MSVRLAGAVVAGLGLVEQGRGEPDAEQCGAQDVQRVRGTWPQQSSGNCQDRESGRPAEDPGEAGPLPGRLSRTQMAATTSRNGTCRTQSPRVSTVPAHDAGRAPTGLGAPFEPASGPTPATRLHTATTPTCNATIVAVTGHHRRDGRWPSGSSISARKVSGTTTAPDRSTTHDAHEFSWPPPTHWAAKLIDANTRPTASSSQPTGFRGWIIAHSAPGAPRATPTRSNFHMPGSALTPTAASRTASITNETAPTIVRAGFIRPVSTRDGAPSGVQPLRLRHE